MGKQIHHIKYDPEWTVELNGYWHKAVTVLQRLSPTPQNYADAINFLHAVIEEVNRIRRQLDTKKTT